MSRFADPAATTRVDLGACECPGTPHASDYIVIRSSLSPGECNAILGVPALDQREQSETIVQFVTEWNLLGPAGEEMPLTADSLFLLDGPSQEALGKALVAAVMESANLPNTSGAPSAASPRRSASPTRKPTRKPGT